jgi:hypothetical protein
MIKFKVTCKKDCEGIYVTTIVASTGNFREEDSYNISFIGRNGTVSFFHNLTFYLNQLVEKCEGKNDNPT